MFNQGKFPHGGFGLFGTGFRLRPFSALVICQHSQQFQ
jgi:hypothetical protein